MVVYLCAQETLFIHPPKQLGLQECSTVLRWREPFLKGRTEEKGRKKIRKERKKRRKKGRKEEKPSAQPLHIFPLARYFTVVFYKTVLWFVCKLYTVCISVTHSLDTLHQCTCSIICTMVAPAVCCQSEKLRMCPVFESKTEVESNEDGDEEGVW